MALPVLVDEDGYRQDDSEQRHHHFQHRERVAIKRMRAEQVVNYPRSEKSQAAQQECYAAQYVGRKNGKFIRRGFGKLQG